MSPGRMSANSHGYNAWTTVGDYVGVNHCWLPGIGVDCSSVVNGQRSLLCSGVWVRQMLRWHINTTAQQRKCVLVMSGRLFEV